MSGPMMIIPPCPPHAWAHAPTVGYFLCSKCNERIDYNDPRYAAMLEDQDSAITEAIRALMAGAA